MNIAKQLDQYNENYIYFCEPIKNNIMNEGTFIRILYSSPLLVLNGIYLLFNLNDVIIEKYYNKYKCVFNINNHKDIIENIRVIEDSILKKSNIKNKIIQHKIFEQLINGNIKIFTDLKNTNNSINPTNINATNSCIQNLSPGNNQFLLKISGIWETEMNFGVTYKFIKINHQ
jgi:hypothetical protein